MPKAAPYAKGSSGEIVSLDLILCDGFFFGVGAPRGVELGWGGERAGCCVGQGAMWSRAHVGQGAVWGRVLPWDCLGDGGDLL